MDHEWASGILFEHHGYSQVEDTQGGCTLFDDTQGGCSSVEDAHVMYLKDEG